MADRAREPPQGNRLKEAAATLKASPEEVPARVAALIEDRRRLERELAEARQAAALGGPVGHADHTRIERIGALNFVGKVLDGVDPKGLRSLLDKWKGEVGSGVVTLVTVNDGRASVAVGVTDDLTGSRNAVELVRKAVEAVGGQGGGGRPDMAQGGGPDGTKAAEAVEAVRLVLGGESVVA